MAIRVIELEQIEYDNLFRIMQGETSITDLLDEQGKMLRHAGVNPLWLLWLDAHSMISGFKETLVPGGYIHTIVVDGTVRIPAGQYSQNFEVVATNGSFGIGVPTRSVIDSYRVIRIIGLLPEVYKNTAKTVHDVEGFVIRFNEYSSTHQGSHLIRRFLAQPDSAAMSGLIGPGLADLLNTHPLDAREMPINLYDKVYLIHGEEQEELVRTLMERKFSQE